MRMPGTDGYYATAFTEFQTLRVWFVDEESLDFHPLGYRIERERFRNGEWRLDRRDPYQLLMFGAFQSWELARELER